MTEKKLKYQKPAMQVFELPRRQLLVGSPNATRQVYGEANPDLPDGETTDANGNWVWD